MRQQHMARYDSVCGKAWGCSWISNAMLCAFAVVPATAAPSHLGWDFQHGAAQGLERAASFISWSITAGYRAAPALMLGLAMLVGVLIIAIVCWFYGAIRHRMHLTAFAAHRTPPDLDEDSATLPDHAFIEVIGPAHIMNATSRPRIALRSEMFRIGREEDNDVRLTEAEVHRYHAAILREDLGSYRIADLTGDAGHGVRVNGQPTADMRLRDGDVIELGTGQLGSGRLRFHAGLV